MSYNSELILFSFQQLIHKKTGSSLDNIKAIKADASDKRIYRLFVNSSSFIGVYNENQKENLAFINFTGTFISLHLNVPEIFNISEDNLTYIGEDLGDKTLFKLAQDSDSYSLMSFYKQAVSDLIKFQILPKDVIDYNYCYQTKEFDSKVIRDDIGKFNEFFAESYLKEKFSKDVLQNITEVSGEVISNVESSYFLYRDFQPRNILNKNNSLYYIDYQSGRKGPLQYDLASFLYSGSIRLSEEQRNYLVDYYLSELKKYIPVNEREFKHYFYFFSFLRLVQVLGSYAYQHVRKNDSEILKKIPKAIANLKSLKDKIENRGIKELIDVLTIHDKN